MTSFLGQGWSFPPTFNGNTGSVKMVSEEEDVLQSLQIILSTIPGERIMHPDFGCELSQFMFEEISQNLMTRIRGTIEDAILFYETRIDLESVEIYDTDEEGLLLISIDYKIRTTNSRFNFVYPFYINETTINVNVYNNS